VKDDELIQLWCVASSCSSDLDWVIIFRVCFGCSIFVHALYCCNFTPSRHTRYREK